MFCEKCGKRAFPIRVACMGCNSTLPDTPAILETPDKRTNPKHVVCVKCGSTAMDARIACIHCDATLARPFRLSEEEWPLEPPPEIAYFVFACPDGACEECMKLDGFHFLPSKLREYRVPIPTCKHPICWCEICGTYRDEGTTVSTNRDGKEVTYHHPGDAADIAAFLERSGGAATAAQIAAYIDSQVERLGKSGGLSRRL
jgi:ribosomal protein L37E